MIRNILIISFLIGAMFFSILSLKPRGASAANGPIVVELFTSQGCSSCPPADQVINQFTENPNLITLSYHVTYWDHLNWKDTLGRKFADQRQRSYSNYKQSNRVYTPQMIINGDKEFVGSRKNEVKKNLEEAKALAQISISDLTPNAAKLSLPAIENGDYYLWVAGVKTKHVEKIGRGENRNKTVTYSNIVLSLEHGARWDGHAKTINIALNETPEIDHYVVFAQNKAYGEIIAAGKINI